MNNIFVGLIMALHEN